jgi:quercetin dioxygenase-like cupin family protein
MIDNARVRVTEWRFRAGEATGWHRHELDYVVVPLTTGRLQVRGSDGVNNEAELVAGRPYFRTAGVEHDVGNENAFEFTFVEIEIKDGR